MEYRLCLIAVVKVNAQLTIWGIHTQFNIAVTAVGYNSGTCMAFSMAFDNSEQSSVSLKDSRSGSFTSSVSKIPDCFALAAKADRIRLTVSFSQ